MDAAIQSLTVNRTAGLSGNNTLTITGATTVNNGTFTLSDDVTVTSQSSGGVSSVIGSQVGSNGTVTVNGGSWTNSEGLYVGNAGNGTLEISGNGSVSSKTGVIGSFAEAIGLAKVSSGRWTNSAELYVGNYGNGTLEISGNGTVSSAVSAIANFAGSTGVAKVSGGAWTNSAELHVGNEGNGTMEISGNGTVTSRIGTIANLSGSRGLAKIIAGSWANTDEVFVGNSGNGTLDLSGTGSVSSALSAIGNAAGATGLALVSGGNWTSSAALHVGNAGNGTMEISGNGTVSSESGSIANLAGSRGMAKVTGGSWTNSEELYVGNGGNGTLEISGAGSVSNKLGVIASFAGATGLAKVSGGTWSNSETLYVGNFGNGTLEISGNGSVTSGVSAIANFAGSRGIAKVSGGNWTNSAELHVGNAGNGTMEISGNGSVTSKIGTVANIAGSTGLAKISAGSWTVTNGLYVGNYGNGTLEISGSGAVASTDAAIANDAASTGVVRVSGGNWTNTGHLAVGVQGNATLRISGTGSVTSGNASVGANSGSRGVATVTGGTWTNTGSLDVGLSGNGTLNIQNGGSVNVAGGNGTVTLGANAGSHGILNMGIFGGSNSTAGTLAAAEVRGGNGTAVLNFNQTSNATFAAIISGSTAVNQLGNATTTLTANNTYTGNTTIQSGTLNFAGDTSQLTGNIVNNSVLRFTQTANSKLSGVISGSGRVNQSGPNRLVVSGNNTYTGGTTIDMGVVETANASALGSGPLTINGGALRATGTLNLGSLTWNAGTIALAPVAGDVINLNGAFTNGKVGGGGLFSLAPEGLLVNQAYTLVSFNSTNFSPGQFSVLWSDPGVQFNSTFILNGDSVQIMITGAEASGDLLHNTQGGVPTYVDFTTIGNVVSGLTENGFQELQTFVNNLFVPNSSLLVPTPNVLTVTGFMDMTNSSLTVNGRLNVLGNFTDPNSIINVNGVMAVGGNTTIDENSTMTVNGSLSVGGTATFTNNSRLTVNTGGLVTVGSTTGISTGSQATINGQLTSPQVHVNGSGLLTGAGRIVGNVLNSGTVAPGNSPGTLAITGDYTQTAGGNLLVEIASQTAFDRLLVGGTANLGGTLQVLATGFSFAYGQQFEVIQAGSITGQFASMTTSDPSNFRVRFLQNGGTGTVLIAPTSYTLVAETQNQRNVAKALDSYIPATTGDRAAVSLALDLLSADQYPAAFDAISPAQYENLASTSIEQSNALSQILQQRFSSVRLTGARGFTQQGLKSPIVSDSGKSYTGKEVREKDILTPAPDNNWGAWVQGDGFFGDFTSLANIPNSRFTSGGVTAGLDYRFPIDVTVGVFAGYQGLYSKYANGGTMNINTVNFGLYAAYEHASGFYANLIVSGGYSGYQVKRSIEFSTIDRTANSDPTGGLLSATIDLGYDWKVRGFTITPTMAGQFTYVGIAPFTETGADSLDLRVNDQAATSLRTSLGARVAYTVNISEKVAFIPQVSLLWQHEFLQNSRNIGAALDGGAGPGFDYATATPSRDAAYAGAGFTLRMGETVSFNANYNVNFGRDDFFSNMVSGGLNFSF